MSLKKEKRIGDDELLTDLFWKTFYGMDRFEDPNTGLPCDKIENGIKSFQTTPTNISEAINKHLIGIHLGINREQSVLKLQKLLHSIDKIPKWNGLIPEWVDVRTLQPLTHWPGSNDPLDVHVSSVDHGHLAAALGIATQVPEVAQLAQKLLDELNLGIFYNSKNGLLTGAVYLDAKKDEYGHTQLTKSEDQSKQWSYGALRTETLITSLIGIAKGDIPEEHILQLSFSNYFLQTNAGDLQFLRSWGGSIFESLMPLLLTALQLYGEIWKRSDAELVRKQILASNTFDGLWGQSPSLLEFRGKSEYQEFGNKHASLWSDGYDSDIIAAKKIGEEIQVATPHALFLSLQVAFGQAIDAIRNLIDKYPHLLTDNGFLDAVSTTGEYPNAQLYLDQGLSLRALTKIIHGDFMAKKFLNLFQGRFLRKFEKMQPLNKASILIQLSSTFDTKNLNNLPEDWNTLRH